jgi:glycosyltransferase involved in cell wall biosynthesis
MKLVSFVIPVYNNAETITLIHQKIRSEVSSNFPELNYEIIFVNDGSKDNSLEQIKKCRQEDPHVKIISFSRNFSQMSAILAGWQYSKGDAVINMSADLQDPVEQCSKMIKEWLDGYNVVLSVRETREDSFINTLTSKIAYRLYKLSIPNMPVGGFDFTLLDRKALAAINSLTNGFRCLQADVLWIGFKVKNLPYTRLKREFGKSQYTFLLRLNFFIKIYLSISYLPIRIMSAVGFFTALAGATYALSITYAYFMHNTPFNGWAPIMIIILIIGGMLMIMLGIIGEYIWRIYDAVQHKPEYIIAEQEGI